MGYHSGHTLIDVQELFRLAQVFPGMHTADLGCGRTGHILFPLAKVLGDTGILYAVDVQKDILESIRKRAADTGFHTIHTIWSNLEVVGATAIPAASLDAVFITNVLSQTDNRHGIIDEARRLLKKKARLIILDWKESDCSFAPEAYRCVDFTDIEGWATMHGFVLQERFDMGPYHHGLVLYRHD